MSYVKYTPRNLFKIHAAIKALGPRNRLKQIPVESIMFPRFLAGSYYVSPVEGDHIRTLNQTLSELPDLKAG